jgi:hypothetical protein
MQALDGQTDADEDGRRDVVRERDEGARTGHDVEESRRVEALEEVVERPDAGFDYTAEVVEAVGPFGGDSIKGEGVDAVPWP